MGTPSESESARKRVLEGESRPLDDPTSDTHGESSDGTDPGASPSHRSGTRFGPSLFRPVLIGISGPSRGTNIPLVKPQTIIGRSGTADFRINDSGSSRHHATITYENNETPHEVPRCYIEDNGSRNGTEVNGRRIQGRVRLSERDRITIGRTVLGYFLRDDAELRYDESLYELATRDPLTGLDNRRQLLALLRSHLARAIRTKTPLTFLLIDADHFKRINDTYGHDVGDEALKFLARILRTTSRDSDLVARWGGGGVRPRPAGHAAGGRQAARRAHPPGRRLLGARAGHAGAPPDGQHWRGGLPHRRHGGHPLPPRGRAALPRQGRRPEPVRLSQRQPGLRRGTLRGELAVPPCHSIPPGVRTMRLPVLVLLAILLAGGARAGIVTKEVLYRDGEVELEGYVAYDDAVQGRRPGVLVVHEWMGLGENARMRARMLAEEGYVAFAVDMYGKGVRAKDTKEAAALAGKYKGDRDLMRGRIRAGLDELLKREDVDPSRVAAIGYCFGGTTVLELARSGAPVAGVVSFHGGLDAPKPAAKGDIKAKVLVLHGADDPYVKPEEVAGFEGEMRECGADWQLVSYGGAVHSFTNQEAGSDKSRGLAYNESADKRSWRAMKDFFAEIFAH